MSCFGTGNRCCCPKFELPMRHLVDLTFEFRAKLFFACRSQPMVVLVRNQGSLVQRDLVGETEKETEKSWKSVVLPEHMSKGVFVFCAIRRFSEHVLFRRAPIVRLVTQVPFGHLSFTLRVSLESWFGIYVAGLAIGAPYVNKFKVC